MKRATPLVSSNPRAKRVCCFDKDNGKVSSFKPNAIPENHFHLGGHNYAVVSDFAYVVRIHLHRYKLDATGSLLPTKKTKEKLSSSNVGSDMMAQGPSWNDS
ncbi:PC4 domain-containing protein [Trichonephila inaurata madagascariensis]|uniref:PC4 domain-containing protein n=1 Tax=Trichonephila inaurata madagascariensis TaxID=2747483 RepID=A0A8X7CN76_9ARAC|nr:PC4 domain-containing protein [Trichonephila inaurata madagascariensis]